MTILIFFFASQSGFEALSPPAHAATCLRLAALHGEEEIGAAISPDQLETRTQEGIEDAWGQSAIPGISGATDDHFLMASVLNRLILPGFCGSSRANSRT
jgi:hypothetical protein